MRVRGRGERGEGRGERMRDQSSTLLIILQASYGAGAQYFLPVLSDLFVCLFVSLVQQEMFMLWMFKSTQRYAPYFHTHTIANLNFNITKD